MKKNFSIIILIFIFVIGLSLLLYPTVSDYWNSFHSSRAIASYVEEIHNVDENQYNDILQAAHRYNAALYEKPNRYFFSEEEEAEYESMLNVSGSGIMGYIEIPSINCSLPIYHGTSESVLQIAVGHIKGTSLPVGGLGTHCVLSGHRGLPSAKLFTNLDRLTNGDQFFIQVLDELLTYEVDQILIVEPDDIDDLELEPGADYCTLVTCTPYGVNSHRLLVRGHRTENPEEAKVVHVSADAVQIEPALIAPLFAVPILLMLLVWLLIRYRKRK